MAKEPADGEKRSEGVSSSPDSPEPFKSSEPFKFSESSEAPGSSEAPERRARSSRGETGPSREETGPSHEETGGTPAGERDRRPDDAPHRRSGERYDRDRYDRDRWDDDRHGRGRPPREPYERDRWDDDRYDRDRRSDDRYDRDRWDDDRYDRDPRSEGADAEGAYPGPIGPPGPSGPPRRRGFRRFRLAAWIALVLAAVVVGVSIAWVSGPPTEAELREKAGLLNKDRLLIGVKEDTPGIALRKPGETGFTGFDIDIAYMIAADLGFRPDQVDFLSIETEDRARMQARDTDGTFVKVDLVVATFSVTPERKADPSVGFSTPYLYTEQSVVTRADYPDDNVASLGAARRQEGLLARHLDLPRRAEEGDQGRSHRRAPDQQVRRPPRGRRRGQQGGRRGDHRRGPAGRVRRAAGEEAAPPRHRAGEDGDVGGQRRFQRRAAHPGRPRPLPLLRRPGQQEVGGGVREAHPAVAGGQPGGGRGAGAAAVRAPS
ncbi:transporter substrate-binding domain-containing protein [Streptosporangium vulgare]|uniref:transporter substrate-binding domain-containing protein n=1 Tax=Streptosporangium vulgare TaxID=46190 RepID=UPI0031CDE6A8